MNWGQREYWKEINDRMAMVYYTLCIVHCAV